VRRKFYAGELICLEVERVAWDPIVVLARLGAGPNEITIEKPFARGVSASDGDSCGDTIAL
jgi:hypothetical protein